MKRLTEQKWFIWLTKYWFVFPIAGFLLLTAVVFFGYGERSYIAVHDNMDLFLAQFQMLKNTGSFFKHGVDVPFLGGISRDDLPSEFSLYTALYMIFPTYTAYILGILGKIVLGIFSFRILAGELSGDSFEFYRPVVYMTGFAYGILWVFPAFGFAFASIPLCVYILVKIYRGGRAGWYAALFAYPLVSYFSYHGIFILGYLLIAFLWLSIRNRKPVWRLAAAFVILALGYMACEYRLFGQMLFSDEVTIRSTIVTADLSAPEILREIGTVWLSGVFHADSVHGKIVLPVCILYFAVNNGIYLFRKEYRRLLCDPFNRIMLFILFNCVVYGLYNCGPVRTLVETILPPLKGWQFNRTVFFNPLLWYAALCIVLVRCYDAGKKWMWAANVIVCAAVLAIILTPNRYNDLYATCRNRAYEYLHGAEVDDLDYEQFYAQELFREIKEDIGYQGEWSAAYGFHPAVLEYNGIATLDGYLGFYAQQYKEDFRRVIAPALERVEATRIYYDNWGARAYLYSGTDLSIVSASKTVYATDYDIYIDVDAFWDLNGRYIFSRLKLHNAEEAGLRLTGEYAADDRSMEVYVYTAERSDP